VKKLSLVIITVLVAVGSFAQNSREEKREKKEAKRQKINEMVRQAEEGVLVYEKQNIFGIQLRSNGYGAFYELGKMKTNRKTNIYRLDITEIKDHKEEKLLEHVSAFLIVLHFVQTCENISLRGCQLSNVFLIPLKYIEHHF